MNHETHKDKQEETVQVASGIFSSAEQLSGALDELENVGVTEDHVMIISEGEADEVTESISTDAEGAAASGAAIGGVGGTALGVLLSSASVVLIPGFGALLAAGVMGAASGVTLGSYLGAIYGSRFAEQVKYDIKDELTKGKLLLLVDLTPFSGSDREKISDLMAAHDGEYVELFEIEKELLETEHTTGNQRDRSSI